MSLPLTGSPLAHVEGPVRGGSERRWRVRLPHGRPAVLAQLLPELARDESIRRRYVRDLERVRALEVDGLARVVEIGPLPDPRDPTADPPFRVREDPPGASLEQVLNERAPLPPDEASALVARLADVVHRIHTHGLVVRDLHPRVVTLTEHGDVWLTDVGLARIDVLSTRTAASLVLEGSPYASPEQLTRTTIDQRSDLYGLGVILFRALTGALPFGDEPAILRDPEAAIPRPSQLRPALPRALDEITVRCLDARPERRPESASVLAATLRGEVDGDAVELARVPCQSCGASLRLGQRLCLRCGQLAVQFETSAKGEGMTVVLHKISEDAEQLARLRGFLESIAEGPVPPLNFIVGDERMYSKAEKAERIRLPTPAVTGLREDSAKRMQARLKTLGIATRLRSEAGISRSQAILAFGFTAFVAGVLALVAALASAPWALALAILGLLSFGLSVLFRLHARKRIQRRTPLVRLRSAPAALPASDDAVRRLAALLRDDTRPDVRELVGELALLVQRLVDHRLEHAAQRRELEVVTAPAQRLVDLVVREVEALRSIDAALATLDEGTIVRALAAAEARRAPPDVHTELLEGLDKLRSLEDERARIFHRLLEASALLRRAIHLGLAVHDEDATHDREVALALAALDP